MFPLQLKDPDNAVSAAKAAKKQADAGKDASAKDRLKMAGMKEGRYLRVCCVCWST